MGSGHADVLMVSERYCLRTAAEHDEHDLIPEPTNATLWATRWDPSDVRFKDTRSVGATH